MGKKLATVVEDHDTNGFVVSLSFEYGSVSIYA